MGTIRPTAVVTLGLRLEEFADVAAGDARLINIEPQVITLNRPDPQPRLDQPAPATQRSLNSRLVSITESIRFVNQQPDSFFEGINSREAFIRDLQVQREDVLDQMIADASKPGPRAPAEPEARGPTSRQRRRQRRQLRATSATELPDAAGGTPPDDRFVRAGIIPISVTVERNSFRSADTCTITLNWTDVPFDPRLLRACAIDAYIGLINAADYDRGVHGQRDENGNLMSNLAAGGMNAVPGFTRFFGFVDTWTVEYDENTGDRVTLECRDLTCLFIDTPLATGSSINLDLPIDGAIRQFMATYPGVANIPVVFGNPAFSGGSGPTGSSGQAPSLARSIPRQNRARRGRRARQQRSGDQRMNLWDHITDVTVALGFIPVVRGTQLFILDPRTLFLSSNIDDGRQRRMVYGRNLKTLQFTRKFQGPTTPTIEVRCYDPTIGRTRWARYPSAPGALSFGILGVSNPPAPSRRPTVTPTGSRAEERIQTYIVRAISDGETLLRIAQSTFEQIGRQEIEGSLNTSDPHSWDIDFDVPTIDEDLSLLTLEAGDPVQMLVAPANNAAAYGRMSAAVIQALPREARAEFLRSLGWSDEVATKFAQLQDAAGFQTTFRVLNARIMYDASDGLDVSVDFVNYVTVRDERAPQNSQPLDPPTPQMAAAIGTPRRTIEIEPQVIDGGVQSNPRAELQVIRDDRAAITALRQAGEIDETSYREATRRLQEQEHSILAVINRI